MRTTRFSMLAAACAALALQKFPVCVNDGQTQRSTEPEAPTPSDERETRQQRRYRERKGLRK